MTRGGKGSVQHGRWRLATGLALAAALIAPGVASAKTTLVEVHSTSHAVLNQLEALGLDVTYEGGTRTELMLHGPEDVQILKDTGIGYDVLMDDMDGANDARLKSEDDHQAKVDKGIAPLSTLPTGRVAYRDLASINAELQQLATTYPDKVKLFTLNKTSLLGKTIYGVEVSHNVAQNIGKPEFQLTGAHHAREWPTAEFTMEFIWDLLLNDGTDADATNLLEKGKLIAIPVVNVDGYDLSRSLQNEQKRKNCRITSGVIPTLADCTLAANINRGIDLNRNYLPFWGGPGSSTSATASNTRGEAPGSEPEIAGMINMGNTNNITLAINNHTPDQRLLRAPSSSNEPDVLADQVAYQSLLDRLSKNLPGWPAGPWTDVYYEASSTAEQQAYYAYGAFGFTPEATPGFSGTQTFHPPYQNVIDNYLGTGTRYAGQTMRGLYYDAFKAAEEPALHSVISGTAPAGATLTLTKTYTLDSSLDRLHHRPAGGGPDVPERAQADDERPGQREVRVAREPVAAARASTRTSSSTSPTRSPAPRPTGRCSRRRRSRSRAASSSTARSARRAGSAAVCRARSRSRSARRRRSARSRPASPRSTTRPRPPTTVSTAGSADA